MSCEYIKSYYQVPADIGRRVTVGGKSGIIAEDRGNYLGVNFDSDKPGVITNAHPVSEVEYIEMGTIRPMTKGQRRYAKYQSVADCFESFLEFCRYEDRREKEGFE